MSEGKHFGKDFTKYHSVFPVTRTVRSLLKNLEQLQSTLRDVVAKKAFLDETLENRQHNSCIGSSIYAGSTLSFCPI